MRKIPTNTYAKIAKSLMKDSSFEQYHGSAEDQAKNFASCLMFDDLGFMYDGEEFEIKQSDSNSFSKIIKEMKKKNSMAESSESESEEGEETGTENDTEKIEDEGEGSSGDEEIIVVDRIKNMIDQNKEDRLKKFNVS